MVDSQYKPDDENESQAEHFKVEASAPMFYGSLLRIKKTNLIVVFSNRDPRIRSHDRWKICLITKDRLTLDHEEKMWQRQSDDHTVTANKNKNSFRK